MANSMSKAQFTLIEDAINEGVEKFVTHFKERLSKNPTEAIATNGLIPNIEGWLRRFLGESFAKRLPYTNDGFDPQKFLKTVTKRSEP